MQVAELTSTRPGEVRCQYTADALDRWPLNTPLLSCSLPLSARRQRADVFFSGLLPEGQHRQAMAAEARLPAHDTFGLLERFGRDVAGAAIIASDDAGQRPGDVELYDTVSTVLWPNLRANAAMSVNGRYSLGRITVADIVAEAGTWSFPAEVARDAALSTAEALATAAADPSTPEQLAEHVAARAAAFLATA